MYNELWCNKTGQQCVPNVKCNTCFLGPPKSTPQHLDRFSHFCTSHGSVVSHVFSSKNCPSHGAIWTPSSTWFLELTRAHNPNGMSIGSAVFAWLTTVTDRPTDHATRGVCKSRRIYERSTATRPKNWCRKTKTSELSECWILMVRPSNQFARLSDKNLAVQLFRLL